jgi:WD40 repeat protein
VQDAVTRLRFVADSHLVVSASLDRRVRLWDTRSGSCARVLAGHRDAVLDLDLTACVLRGEMRATSGLT